MMTLDELRRFATAMRDTHDSTKQGHGFDRCEHCGFGRSPCDVYELANETLALLTRLDHGFLACGAMHPETDSAYCGGDLDHPGEHSWVWP